MNMLMGRISGAMNNELVRLCDIYQPVEIGGTFLDIWEEKRTSWVTDNDEFFKLSLYYKSILAEFLNKKIVLELILL